MDSVLPLFTYQQALGCNYADSVYTISLEYPEFIDMQPTDILRYQQIAGSELPPEMPVVHQYIGVSRRQGTLYASFCPIVYRDDKYQKLVSFMIKTKASLECRVESVEFATALDSSAAGSPVANSKLYTLNSKPNRAAANSSLYTLPSSLIFAIHVRLRSSNEMFSFVGSVRSSSSCGVHV